MAANNVAQAYRLDGEVDGRPVVFHLAFGEHRVGSSGASEVHLPVSGVSRQHARLIATDGSLIVEDCGSTNGTFVDDEAVERAPIPAGATIQFGPIRLELTVLTDPGSQLAIRVDPPAQPTPTADPMGAPTTHIEPVASNEATTLVAVEGLLARCHWSGPIETVGEVLDAVAQTVPMAGVAAVLWTADQEPVVLASRGALGPVPTKASFAASLTEDVFGIADASVLADSVHRTTVYVSQISASARCGLVLWDKEAGAGLPPAFARTATRMIARCVEGSTPSKTADHAGAASRPASPELVVPATYHASTSQPMRTLESEMAAAANGSMPVFIHGETGVGKELVARIIHASSPRAAGPFVAINCAALPAELLEAEMFGIGRGVATGVSQREGQFARAEGGTLFLDEVGELATGLQAKLLRALQEREIQPVGAPPRPVDVRVIAATNVSLQALGEDAPLRKDLFFRLAGCLIEVPPLRRRKADIPGLVEHFLRRLRETDGIRVCGVTAGALARLEGYAWPGNVRELEHEVGRAARTSAVRGTGAVIDESCLSRFVGEAQSQPLPLSAAHLDDLDLNAAVERLERALIREALARTGGRKAPAARLLGVSRSGFEGRLRRLDMVTPDGGEKKRSFDRARR
ncbi:MAG: sigma 54-interacting transcriptional regulator [Thermoanaerobaculia bacterium]|nr:sigma 54-interacting transcriptional regulator [Thermoanaerobaculia bacterium]